MKNEYKAYLINVDIIRQGHSWFTGKTQEEATNKALAAAHAYGHMDAKVMPNGNVEYSGGYSL